MIFYKRMPLREVKYPQRQSKVASLMRFHWCQTPYQAGPRGGAMKKIRSVDP